MNKLFLVGRVVYFDELKRTLKLRVQEKNKVDEFVINFPNMDKTQISYLQERFGFNEIVKVKAYVTISKQTKKLEIHASEINFYK